MVKFRLSQSQKVVNFGLSQSIAMDPKRYGIKFTGNPENYWHHLPYEIAVDHEAQDVDNFMRRVQSLYPEAAIIDVSEDILYCAKLGHDILRTA